jgi:hypothetical protein
MVRTTTLNSKARYKAMMVEHWQAHLVTTKLGNNKGSRFNRERLLKAKVNNSLSSFF